MMIQLGIYAISYWQSSLKTKKNNWKTKVSILLSVTFDSVISILRKNLLKKTQKTGQNAKLKRKEFYWT